MIAKLRLNIARKNKKEIIIYTSLLLMIFTLSVMIWIP